MASATAKRSRRASRASHAPRVCVKVDCRSCAVGILVCKNGQLTSICEQHSSIEEALAFCESYNQLGDDRKAVILPQADVAAFAGEQPRKEAAGE